MNGQDVINKSLDANLLDFEDKPEIKELVVIETPLPDATEDFNQVRKNLYDLNDKCMAALNYLVDNIEFIQQQPGILKATPTELISDIVKTALQVNDKLIKVNTPVTPKSMTQINMKSDNPENKDLKANTNALKDLDKKLKEIKDGLKQTTN